MFTPAFATALPCVGAVKPTNSTSVRRNLFTTPTATATAPIPNVAPYEPPFFRRSKEFGVPNAVPQSGRDRVMEIMEQGTMFRYSTGPEDSDATSAELAIASAMGFKYCIGTNSCTSAIVLALRVLGVTAGDKVLTNCFTFTAVPSSIVACGATPILVDSNNDFHMDVESLRAKLFEHPDVKAVLLSHFRGRVSDCDAILNVCNEFGVTLVEDCAHCLGVKYKGVPAGRRGVLAAVSVQADKVVNAGEGGFVVTDNPDYAADLIYLSGAYERRFNGHLAAPVDHEERIVEAMLTQPNLSYRMSNIVGALVNSQIPLLSERCTKWNKNGAALDAALKAAIRTGVIALPRHAEGVRGVQDHYVFRTPNFDTDQRAKFLKMCNARGIAVKHLGGSENARYYKNWNYLSNGSREGYEKTCEVVRNAWDLKMPLAFSEDDWIEVGDLMTMSAFEAANA